MNAFPKVRLAVLFLLIAYVPLHGAALRVSEGIGEVEPKRPLVAEEELDFLERLEFRSFTQFSGRMFFGLHDPLEKESFTLEAGMVRRGIEIVAFNRAGNVLSVRSGEATREIAACVAGSGRGLLRRLKERYG